MGWITSNLAYPTQFIDYCRSGSSGGYHLVLDLRIEWLD